MKQFLTTTFLIISAISCGSVLAQPARNNSGAKPITAQIIGPLKRFDAITIPGETIVSDESSLSPDRPKPNYILWGLPEYENGLDKNAAQAYALKSFSVKFTNGDHKIRWIKVLPLSYRTDYFYREFLVSGIKYNPLRVNAPRGFKPTEYYITQLADVGGEDPMVSNLELLDVSQGLRGNSDGKISLQLERQPSRAELEQKYGCVRNDGLVPLLSGFRFVAFPSNIDKNVRRLAANCLANGELISRFDDDRGFDARDLQNLVANTTSTAAESMITWVRPEIIKYCKIYVGQNRRDILIDNNNGKVAIQGFDFEFLNSDHHLLELGIKIVGNRMTFQFQDNNQDDPFQYRVRLCYLN